MDTGSYMENQMSDQIENSLHQYDEFCNELEKEITEHIKQYGYTWTAEEIFTEYREKYSKGIYVSFTCGIVIKKIENKLKLMYQ